MITKDEYFDALEELNKDIIKPLSRFTWRTGINVRIEFFDPASLKLNDIQMAIWNCYKLLKAGYDKAYDKQREPENKDIAAELSNPNNKIYGAYKMKRDGSAYPEDWVRKQRRIIQDKGYDVGLDDRP